MYGRTHLWSETTSYKRKCGKKLGNIHAPKAVTYHEQSHYCRFMIGHSLGRMGGVPTQRLGTRSQTLRTAWYNTTQRLGTRSQTLRTAWCRQGRTAERLLPHLFRVPSSVTHTLTWVVRPMCCMVLNILTQFPLRTFVSVNNIANILRYLYGITHCRAPAPFFFLALFFFSRFPAFFRIPSSFTIFKMALRWHSSSSSSLIPKYNERKQALCQRVFSTHFRLYEVVSLHMCVPPCMYRKI